jgi:hypothetical protein
MVKKMSATEEMAIEEKVKKEVVKKRKSIKKPNNSLAAIFGMLKGKIFYDEEIFNFAK